MPYFYGVYPENQGLCTFFGLIRYIMEPDAVRFAHITIRGPYERKLDRARLASLNNIVSSSPIAKLCGATTFFGANQNTVALTVDIMELRSIWYKPHYPNGDPHVTLYDGDNRRAAILLRNVISSYDWGMRFRITPLRLLEPKVSDRDGFLKFTMAIYRAYDKCHEGDLPPLNSMRNLRIEDRIAAIERIMLRVGLPRVDEDVALFA
jgi:hypothetical protein